MGKTVAIIHRSNQEAEELLGLNTGRFSDYSFGNMFSGSGALRRIGTGECIECPLCDVDMSRDEDEYQRSLRYWDNTMRGELSEAQSMRERFADRETYARRMSTFSTDAVITKDGVWHEVEDEYDSDWYDNYYRDFIETEDRGLVITIAWCH